MEQIIKIDCNISFFGNGVTIPTMYLIMGGTVAVLIGIYVLLNASMKNKQRS